MKYFTRVNGDIDLIPFKKLDNLFVELDWREPYQGDHKFIRLTGNATAEEASEVVNVIASLRKASDAFVISNAVKIEGVADFEAITQMSFEDIKKINVLDMLLEEFNDAERNVIKELLG